MKIDFFETQIDNRKLDMTVAIAPHSISSHLIKHQPDHLLACLLFYSSSFSSTYLVGWDLDPGDRWRSLSVKFQPLR